VRGGAERHGKAYEFHRYDGPGHGIFYYHTSMDWPEQAMDGWEKVFGFSSRDLSG
jgi:carboxymethylenebutenolidase